LTIVGRMACEPKFGATTTFRKSFSNTLQVKSDWKAYRLGSHTMLSALPIAYSCASRSIGRNSAFRLISPACRDFENG
jgi:hypothetical protein